MLTLAERFKDARTVYNKNGKQTMDEVASNTGINKSLISDLEDDEKDRNVGFKTVAKLCGHYGVSSDYLLGLSNDYKVQKCATDELGLSVEAVSQLLEWKKDHPMYIGILSALICSMSFPDLLSDIYHYCLLTHVNPSTEDLKLISEAVKEDQINAMNFLGGKETYSPIITAFIALKSNLNHLDIAEFYLHSVQDSIKDAVKSLHYTG